MKAIINRFIDYLKKDSEIDITLFKILGLAGIAVSVIAGTQSIVMGVSLVGGLTDFLAAILSALLLWYVDKTGKYVHGYIITTIVVFMGLFTLLFFEMSGLDGSMTYFFAFSLVFSFLMFRGKLLVVMEIIETLFYVGVCYFSYKHPEYVTPFENEQDMFLDRVSGIILSGIGIGLIFSIYIVQYRKQKEIAEEASRAKSTFLANMSHEIRTPINMMMGMNEMIYREAETEAIKEYALNAEAAGKQLLFEVNQVLQFSRLNAGKEELIEEPYSLTKMLNNLNAYFEKEASGKNLDFLMVVDPKVPTALKGDMRKLLQIFTNLLSNAIKYTSEGNIRFSVTNEGIADGAAKLYFEVKDTGIGIKAEEIDHIFTSFERADLLKNRNIEGTGLGLAIASHLAGMFGSKIEVESEYGKGSRFYIRVSQKIANENEISGESGTNGTFIAPDARIMVVDDNLMNLSVVKSLLKKTMVQVTTAKDARECYDLFKSEKPDLVLMDYMMPEIDGIEAMKHLREIGGAGTPILVLTADVSPEKQELFLSEGFDGYLTKPVDWHELESNIMDFLPSRLVTRINENASKEFSEEMLAEYDELLKPYDVSLPEGIKYVGGDLRQYARIAKFFTENLYLGTENLKRYVENGDLTNLTLLFHSLKGNARNVGAIELHYMTKRLEKRCRQGDVTYINTACELALLEWSRAGEGLTRFLEEFKNATAFTDTEKETNPASTKEKTDLLLSYIDSNNRSSAIKLIDEMLRSDMDADTAEKLSKARDLISEIEFDAAGELIKNIL